jgi:hypothetical protein
MMQVFIKLLHLIAGIIVTGIGIHEHSYFDTAIFKAPFRGFSWVVIGGGVIIIMTAFNQLDEVMDRAPAGSEAKEVSLLQFSVRLRSPAARVLIQVLKLAFAVSLAYSFAGLLHYLRA